jgi:hypothetical protein
MAKARGKNSINKKAGESHSPQSPPPTIDVCKALDVTRSRSAFVFYFHVLNLVAAGVVIVVCVFCSDFVGARESNCGKFEAILL